MASDRGASHEDGLLNSMDYEFRRVRFLNRSRMHFGHGRLHSPTHQDRNSPEVNNQGVILETGVASLTLAHEGGNHDTALGSVQNPLYINAGMAASNPVEQRGAPSENSEFVPSQILDPGRSNQTSEPIFNNNNAAKFAEDEGKRISECQMEPLEPPNSEPQKVLNLECSICREVMKKETATSCGHMFCEECIRGCLLTSSDPRCPQCRIPLSPTHIFRIYMPNIFKE